LNNPSLSNPTATPTSTTTYTVTATDANGCLNSATTTVTVNPLPVVTASGPQAICIGAGAQLTAGGGVTYTWTPQSGLSNPSIYNPTAIPTSTTTYTVTATDANGCVNRATTTITVNPLPIVTASAPQSICIGASAQLTGGGGVTYSWTPPAGLDDPSIFNPTATPTSTTTYTVTAINANGCVNSAMTTVTVNPLPVVTVSSPQAICIGAGAQLTAGGGVTYTWTPQAGLSNPSIYNPTATPGATTIYTVTATDANGCVNRTTTTVTIKSIPTVTVSHTTAICIGNSTQLTATGGIN
jgi:hypothetical protein